MIRLILNSRLYKSGTVWCLWRWTFVDSDYITRLHVVKTPWFAVCLHWIDKPDPEPYLHDHPVSFLSIILQGSYWEERVTKDASPRFYHRRWFNLVRASAADRHSIVKVDPDTLTLALMGPKVREWGFHDGPSWTLWKDYYTAKRKA